MESNYQIEDINSRKRGKYGKVVYVAAETELKGVGEARVFLELLFARFRRIGV